MDAFYISVLVLFLMFFYLFICFSLVVVVGLVFGLLVCLLHGDQPLIVANT